MAKAQGAAALGPWQGYFNADKVQKIANAIQGESLTGDYYQIAAQINDPASETDASGDGTIDIEQFGTWLQQRDSVTGKFPWAELVSGALETPRAEADKLLNEVRDYMGSFQTVNVLSEFALGNALDRMRQAGVLSQDHLDSLRSLATPAQTIARKYGISGKAYPVEVYLAQTGDDQSMLWGAVVEAAERNRYRFEIAIPDDPDLQAYESVQISVYPGAATGNNRNIQGVRLPATYMLTGGTLALDVGDYVTWVCPQAPMLLTTTGALVKV